MRFRELAEAADELLHRVDEALVTGAAHGFMVETRAKVDALAGELRDALAGLGEKQRATMERTVGRKVTDLQHRAARLPTLSAGSAAKTTTSNEFVENRPPPPSRPKPPPSATRAAPPPKVARPKRVVDRRAEKTKAARRPALDEAALRNAAVVKPYAMDGSYELGDVIAHATFGRGRVEGLQPRVMQVQFATGMKSLRTK